MRIDDRETRNEDENAADKNQRLAGDELMDHPRIAVTFEAERPRLLGLAYRLLGSVSDAEDVVQDAWLRWQTVDRTAIDSPPAWLTTVVSRLGIDRAAGGARTAFGAAANAHAASFNRAANGADMGRPRRSHAGRNVI